MLCFVLLVEVVFVVFDWCFVLVGSDGCDGLG